MKILRFESAVRAHNRNQEAAVQSGLPRVTEGDLFYGSDLIWVQEDDFLYIPDNTHHLLSPAEIERLEDVPSDEIEIEK